MYAVSRQSIAVRERIPRPVLDVGDRWISCLRDFNIAGAGESTIAMIMPFSG